MGKEGDLTASKAHCVGREGVLSIRRSPWGKGRKKEKIVVLRRERVVPKTTGYAGETP